MKKIGFWQLFALVIGCQIGSTVLISPAVLAPFGYFAFTGWLISGLGAISLAMVFARLCGWFPRTGGTHVYALEAFGSATGFFTGWTYWVVSWASTTAVIVATVAYAEPLTGPLSPNSSLGLQILILVAVTWLNCLGVYAAGGA
ncbi:MAG: amino acid permease, partial [Deltaproteobacteria bacterium]|nr:amino acid permease [Deltaproteobacteria bacterium]